jgi:DNA-binding MarR family transcriptional regulator
MLEYGILLPFAMQLKKLYGKACRDVCVKYELTQTEFDILDFLGERSGLDTAGEIARRRLIKKANVSTSVERLIRKGLLLRRADKRDRRIIHLELTPAADRPVKEIRAVQKTFFATVFSPLTREEQVTLKKLLDKLMNTAVFYGESLKGAL